MKRKLIKYFNRRSVEREREQSRRLGDAGFLLGAAVAASDEKSDDMDIICCGVAGFLAVALFEVACPKTAALVKAIL